MRRNVSQFLLWCLVSTPALFGQGLEISAATAAPGDFTALQIAFRAPPGKEVLALQWDLLVPTQPLNADWDRVLRLFVPVQDAGKSVHCAISDPAAATRVLRCILFGGQKPIPTGPVALISLQVRDNARAGLVPIRLQNIVGVDREVRGLSFAPVEASITVARK